MYRIYVKDNNSNKEYPIYEPLDDTMRVFNPVLTWEMGNAGAFDFGMYVNHPNFSKLELLKSEIIIYDDDEIIYCGRLFGADYSFENLVSLNCEGILNYLIDSQKAPYEHTGSIAEFIKLMLDNHNAQVEDYKKIYVGNIVVSDSNGYTLRSNTKYNNTSFEIREKLVNIYGGYLRIRQLDGRRYLDYLWDFGGNNDQVIRFGENLLDMDKYMDASQIITCMIPEGASVEYQDDLGQTQTSVVDITSVNGGVNYIKNTDAIAKYGMVWGYKQWTDVNEPANLLAKAKASLTELSMLPATMQINAVDLSLIDTNVQKFRLGYWTDVISAPHGIEHKFLLSKIIIDLLDPTAGSITLGRQVNTLTGANIKTQADLEKSINLVANNTSSEINRKIENATSLITGGLGGYVVIDNIDPNTGKIMHPWRILIMNTPNKDTASNVIQINQNGIGFSTTGINGPYRNAWTIDGNLVADFITTGSMLANRIRGGSLEMGGGAIGKDGNIVMYDAAGIEIGHWNKNGLTVKKGDISGSSLKLGGSTGADGSIFVYNAAGTEIGRWDKNGISIKAGTITGGTINIGNGTFVVDNNGKIKANSGNIEIGPLSVNEEELIMGDYTISSDGTNLLNSANGWVRINAEGQPSGSPGGGYASLYLGGAGYGGLTIKGMGEITGAGNVTCEHIYCNGDISFPNNSWMGGWTLIQTLKDIYEKLDNLG